MNVQRKAEKSVITAQKRFVIRGSAVQVRVGAPFKHPKPSYTDLKVIEKQWVLCILPPNKSHAVFPNPKELGVFQGVQFLDPR